MTTTAWYIVQSDRPWTRWFNLLHWPYTLWHLSYVAIGAALVSDLNMVLLGWTVLAFFLGMGVAGHAFDLINGDPLKLGIRPKVLWVVGFISVALAGFIGAAQIIQGNVSPWLLFCIPFGIVLAVGYGKEWKYLHGDWQFAAWWGMFPLLVGYLAQDVSWNPALIPAAAFAYFSSGAQRTISTRSRYLRRKVGKVSISLHEEVPELGQHQWKDQDKSWMLFPMDQALRLLSFALPVIAIMLILDTLRS